MRVVLGLHNKDDYFVHTLTCMYSFLTTASCPLEWYLFHDATVGDDIKTYFCALTDSFGAQMQFVDVSPVAAQLATHVQETFSIATFFRTLIPQYLPDGEVLYVDSDMCSTLDIATLLPSLRDWTECAAAVPDAAMVMPRFARHVCELGVGAEQYFNAGLMYLHTGRINARFPEFFSQIVAILNRRRYNFPDQDALNIFFAAQSGSVRYLPEKFNYSLSVRKRHLRPAATCADRVLHYGYHKPWAEVFPAGMVYWRFREAMAQRMRAAGVRV